MSWPTEIIIIVIAIHIAWLWNAQIIAEVSHIVIYSTLFVRHQPHYDNEKKSSLSTFYKTTFLIQITLFFNLFVPRSCIFKCKRTTSTTKSFIIHCCETTRVGQKSKRDNVNFNLRFYKFPSHCKRKRLTFVHSYAQIKNLWAWNYSFRLANEHAPNNTHKRIKQIFAPLNSQTQRAGANLESACEIMQPAPLACAAALCSLPRQALRRFFYCLTIR